jgi:signal transduction histidine kinase
LAIVVRDEGPGIPMGAEEKIFRPFQRLGASVKEGVSGAGLGLAIARDLARQMGGELRCEGVSAGAAFVLRIPVAEEPGNIVEMGEEMAS